MSLLRNVVAAGLYLSLTPALVQAQVSPPGAHPPQAGWAVSARYRFEGVDSDAFQREAEAHTVSVRAGYSFRFADGWSALLEGEGVAELNDHFNSGANGETAFPAVPDGRAVEINQAWVDWQRPSVGTRVGRQRIVLDNARFIGDVAWRQNMQTFDAAQLRWQPLAGWDLQAYLVDRVHRVAGDNARDRLARERDLDARLLRVSRTLGSSLLVGYGYWVEDQDVPQASSRTAGLRWTGAWPIGDPWKLGLSLEGATQRPWADARGGSSTYWLIEPRVERGPLVLKLGSERLGSGGGRAFQTPLATLHAFNGWADVFLVTPVDGLEDRYAGVQGSLPMGGKAFAWQIVAHDYQSVRGNDYGREWNASMAMPLQSGLSALVKYADYRSNGFMRDTRKVWIQLEWKL